MSLKAIAKELGISVTTVSRALNGYDDVSQETRVRVETEAQRRGYRPNTFARRLKMGKIDAVGLVFPMRGSPLNNKIFLDMVGEISHELSRHEIDLLLIADDEQVNQHGYMRLVQSRRVDALIVAHTLDDDPRLTRLLSAGFPFLALGRSRLPQPYAWFDFDNYAGTYRATRYLISQGHRRIAMLGENNSQAFITQRRNGYLAALQEAGLSDSCVAYRPPGAKATRRRWSFYGCRSHRQRSSPTVIPLEMARLWLSQPLGALPEIAACHLWFTTVFLRTVSSKLRWLQ